jgi:hypothetical protein
LKGATRAACGVRTAMATSGGARSHTRGRRRSMAGGASSMAASATMGAEIGRRSVAGITVRSMKVRRSTKSVEGGTARTRIDPMREVSAMVHMTSVKGGGIGERQRRIRSADRTISRLKRFVLKWGMCTA